MPDRSMQRCDAMSRQPDRVHPHDRLVHGHDVLELGVRPKRRQCQLFGLIHERVINSFVHARSVALLLMSVDSHFPTVTDLSMPALCRAGCGASTVNDTSRYGDTA